MAEQFANKKVPPMIVMRLTFEPHVFFFYLQIAEPFAVQDMCVERND